MKTLTIDPKKKSFTKIIMAFVVVLYVIGALIGGGLVIFAAYADWCNTQPINSQMFMAYAAYLGTPTATAIAFYAWKSKCENIIKIKQNDNTVDITALSNMGGNT